MALASFLHWVWDAQWTTEVQSPRPLLPLESQGPFMSLLLAGRTFGNGVVDPHVTAALRSHPFPSQLCSRPGACPCVKAASGLTGRSSCGPWKQKELRVLPPPARPLGSRAQRQCRVLSEETSHQDSPSPEKTGDSGQRSASCWSPWLRGWCLKFLL